MNYDPAYLKTRPVVVRESTEVRLSKEIIKNKN